MSDARRLLKVGTILTLEPGLETIEDGEILIVGDRIEAVGRDLGVADAEVLDFPEGLAIPGFVDTHRHTWQAPLRLIASDWTLGHYMTGLHSGFSKHFRPEDTYLGNLLGTLEALESGITTLLDWSHNLATPEHADAAIEGLIDSGSRAIFAHGGGSPQWQVPSPVEHPEDVKRIKAEHFSSDDGLVTMAMALRGPQFATKERTVEDYRLAREVDCRITVHVGDGEFGLGRPVAWLSDQGLLADDVTYVHCNQLGDDELRMIADTGGTASVAADIELQMGHGWPATGRLLDVGIRPSLSIDVCSSNGGDMFGAMRSTIASERGLQNAAGRDRGQWVVDELLGCRDVVEFATIEGARANGMSDRIGSLAPGKQADVVVLDASSLALKPLNNPWGALVYAAHPGIVDTVIVAGADVKRGGELVGVDRARLDRLVEETREHLWSAVAEDPPIAEAAPGGEWKPEPLRA